jgi:anti-sigma regulatory factor (Ser/Thr protein kinase)
MESVLGSRWRQQRHHIIDASHVSAVRRAAGELASQLGFGEVRAGEAAICVTEAATNILKHAGSGEILLRPVPDKGLEIIAIDRGPGVDNLQQAFEDGTSSAGSYGVGFGAMRRMAAELDIYSIPGQGTALYMLLCATAQDCIPDRAIGVVCLPLPSETICGDCWGVASLPTEATLMVADGLGHGPQAATASETAVALLAREHLAGPAILIDDAHGALRPTRGAAVAVARLDTLAETLTYAGIGNIAAHVIGPGQKRQLVSHNGIVGSNMRKVQEFTCALHEGTLLIMHSDGLGSRWDLDVYPGLAARHPALIAAILYRDHCRGRDDVTVIVLAEEHRQRT